MSFVLCFRAKQLNDFMRYILANVFFFFSFFSLSISIFFFIHSPFRFICLYSSFYLFIYPLYLFFFLLYCIISYFALFSHSSNSPQPRDLRCDFYLWVRVYHISWARVFIELRFDAEETIDFLQLLRETKTFF